MRAVKSRDTTPEMTVRRLIHAMGYRYRLHRKDLPGKPDLAFVSARKVIFVHGCFWHGHKCKRGDRRPATNKEYWNRKLDRNIARDARNQARLGEIGWRSLIVWECETKDSAQLAKRLAAFLEN